MPPGKKLLIALALGTSGVAAGWCLSYFVMAREYGDYSVSLHLEVLGDSSQSIEKTALKMFASGFLLVLVLGLLVMVTVSTQGQVIKDLHGSARWAKLADLKNAGIVEPKRVEQAYAFNSSGVYIGGFKQGKRTLHLKDDSNTHLLCFAPTRSGKGVSLILPTLLTNHKKSFFIYDIKGENFAISSGWREMTGSRIIKLELASPDSHKYNPLDEIEFGSTSFTQDIQNLAGILTDSGDGKNSRSDHWQDKARELLTALLVYTLEDSSRERSLYFVGNLLTDPKMDLEETIDELVENCTDPVAKNIFIATRNTPEKERGSVISTLRKTFELFADPVIRENTSSSDFRIRDLVNGETPVSLYFIVQPNDLSRLNSMVRVFVTQLFSKLIVGMEFEGGTSKQKNKFPLILMMDEFASMKYMPVMEEGLAFIAGYGVRAYLIVQDLDQIHKYYGRENGIIGNCHTQIAFAPNSNNTAKYLVEQLGKTTIVRRKVSRSSGKHRSRSTSVEEVGRELLTVDEARRLKMIDVGGENEGGETLVMRSGEPPIKGTRVLYFTDPVLSDRSKVAASNAATIKKKRFKL